MPRARCSAIRHVDAPYDGPRFIGADNDNHLFVWDLASRRQVASIDTLVDFGGARIAINPRGDICAVGSHTQGGLECFAVDSGDLICVRDDLGKLYRVRYSPDGRRLFCGGEKGRLTVLDAETGADLDRYPATEKLFCSPFQPLELACKDRERPLELRPVGGKRIARLVRESFAVLDAAFGPDRLCISEPVGPVRCVGTESGEELWRFASKPNWHVLRLAYAPAASAFFGVDWNYMRGGKRRLLRFDPETGESRVVATLARSAIEFFCARGSILLTTAGELVDVVTGASEMAFAFPAWKKAE